MNINQTVALNLSESITPPTLRMAQDDANTRTIKASLWDGAQPFSIPSECVCMVRFGKPDGIGGLYDTTEGGQKVSYSGNVVTAPVAAQMLAVAGAVKAQIDIYGGGEKQQTEKLATFRFRVEVEPSAYADAKIISSDYYNVLSSQIAAAVEAGAKADQAIQAAQQATNAASSASQSQTAAASSAQSASQSAQTASSAATSATSAKAAAESAQEAAQTANESAASSASSASQDAQSAAQAAAAAIQDADDAEAWAVGKRNGADVPSTDPTYHNNAKYYKDQAQAVVGDKVDSFNGRTGTVTPQAGDYTAEMVGAQPLLTPGDNISISGSVIATKAFPCNPNLLDNWYFGNPVNQRGQTSYTGTDIYTIDRWMTDNTVTVVDGGITVKRTVYNALFYQYLEDSLVDAIAGRVVTYSALTTNGLMTVTTKLPPSKSSDWDTDNAAQGDLVLDTVKSGAGKIYIRFYSTVDGTEATILAVKLELGSVQTLAHQENGVWVLNEIPDYGEQLRRCQRYQYPILGGMSTGPIGYGYMFTKTQARIFIPTGVPMRVTPVVRFLLGSIGNLYIVSTEGRITVSSVTVDNFITDIGQASGVVLLCNIASELTASMACVLTGLVTAVQPMLDANL